MNVLLFIPTSLYSTGQAVTFLRYVEPRYPEQARRIGIQGYVLVELSLKDDGAVFACEVVSSAPKGYFEDSVREAALKWQVDISATNEPIDKLRQHVAFSLCDQDEPCVNRRNV